VFDAKRWSAFILPFVLRAILKAAPACKGIGLYVTPLSPRRFTSHAILSQAHRTSRAQMRK
jgi:hypothetical protein